MISQHAERLIHRLHSLAILDDTDLGENEETVKIKFAVELLKALGHRKEDLCYEDRRRDIVTDGREGVDRVVVETKRRGKPLEKDIPQLERYCSEERPLVGILTNGDEIRIYCPGWQERGRFGRREVYRFSRRELADPPVQQALWRVLSAERLKDGSAAAAIRQRKKEIGEAEERIMSMERSTLDALRRLHVSVQGLTDRVEGMRQELDRLNDELVHSLKDSEKRVSLLEREHGLPGRGRRKRPPSSALPRGLEDALNVAALMLGQQRLDFPAACKRVARDRSVEWSTTHGACTGRLGLKAAEFTKLTTQPKRLVAHLGRRYPGHKEQIRRRIPAS